MTKAIITGASGFIGARLVKAAVDIYGRENVTAISSVSNEHCHTILYKDRFIITAPDTDRVKEADVLIHAGAFTPKTGSDANNIDRCGENISHTERLLKLPLANLRRAIYLSTLDVYSEADLISENTPTIPSTLYGWSKLYSEKVVENWTASRNIDCFILRLGHVYGPGEERYLKFIPQAIKNILADDCVEIWGDGTELRSFIYIDDVISAILAAASTPLPGDIVNVAGSNSISIADLLANLVKISGKSPDIKTVKFNGRKRDYVFDTAKLRATFLPVETPLDEGLRVEFEHIALQR